MGYHKGTLKGCTVYSFYGTLLAIGVKVLFKNNTRAKMVLYLRDSDPEVVLIVSVNMAGCKLRRLEKI